MFVNKTEEQASIITEKELLYNSVILITDGKKRNLKKFGDKIIHIRDIYREKLLPQYEGLKRFKNIHQGERCFIIGNGPSLLVEDLELLKRNKEITFGVNRIYKIFDKTEWRPDYYVIVDSFLQDKISNEIEKYDFSAVFVGKNYTNDINNLNDRYFCFSRMANNLDEDNFSENIENFIYAGGTVIYEVMQIAAYMGFKEIIVLGVDMSEDKVGEKFPHFYEEEEDTSNRLGRGNTSYALAAFPIARKYAKEHGIEIKNATRGGNLEEFPRINMDTFFCKI